MTALLLRCACAAFAVAVLGAQAAAQTGAKANPQAQAARRAAPPVCAREDFRVAVDVGHTREFPGARGARGRYEYDFNLDLARAIEQAMLAAGFRNTSVLVTAGSAQQSLFRRLAQANALGAHLFLSIHHDSVPDQFLLTWFHGGGIERFSDAYRGHSIFISADNAEATASLRFGHLLGMQLKRRGMQYTTQYTEPLLGDRRRVLVDATAGVYRYDQLIVLRHATMPAVLLEAGSIINRDEEALMMTPERQKLIAAAATAAVDEFCAARLPRIARSAPANAGRDAPAAPR